MFVFGFSKYRKYVNQLKTIRLWFSYFLIYPPIDSRYSRINPFSEQNFLNSSDAFPKTMNDSISKNLEKFSKFGPFIKSSPCLIPSKLLLYLSISVTLFPSSET